MHVKSRLALAGATAVLALALNPAAALAGDDGGNIIKADFTPSLPSDPPILGVAPGGVPWILDRGTVRVRHDGRIDVRLDGLQVPGSGPGGTDANPVGTITATLYCNGSTEPAAVSAPQPLSMPEGDARFRDTLSGIPAVCDHAVVLINPGNPARFIASAFADDEDDD